MSLTSAPAVSPKVSSPSVNELLLRIQELELEKKDLRIRVKIEISTLLAENDRLKRELEAAKSGVKLAKEEKVDDSKDEFVESGTFEELVKYLYSGATTTTDYIKVFLLTYRAFCGPSELLAALKGAFLNLGEGEQVCLSEFRPRLKSFEFSTFCGSGWKSASMIFKATKELLSIL